MNKAIPVIWGIAFELRGVGPVWEAVSAAAGVSSGEIQALTRVPASRVVRQKRQYGAGHVTCARWRRP